MASDPTSPPPAGKPAELAFDLPRLAQRLREQGCDEAAARLLRLAPAIESRLGGGSWLRRNGERLVAALRRHLSNAQAEAEETRLLLQVARKVLVERRRVPVEELEKAREQLLDLAKTVPASALLAGLFLLPIPGAQPVLAPLLMERLGLMPSAWDESALASEVRDLVAVAAANGLAEVAAELAGVLKVIRSNRRKLAGLSAFFRRHPDLKVFADLDMDSRPGEEELAALQRAVAVAAARARERPNDAVWYVFHRPRQGPARPHRHAADETCFECEGYLVEGPLPISVIAARLGGAKEALVRAGREGAWLPLSALTDEIQAPDGCATPSAPPATR